MEVNQLGKMMDQQRKLIDFYREIEGYPLFPLNLTQKSNQKIIKDFGNRFIEELAEAYDNIANALESISKNEADKAQDFVRWFNDELGDAWHFFLEFLISIGWDEDEINNRAHAFMLDTGLPYKASQQLENLSLIGSFFNYRDGTTAIKTQSFRVFFETEIAETPENAGGRIISARGLEMQQQFLWCITYKLKMALNLLKNRDWAKEERQVNEIQFHDGIFETIIILMRYMDYIGKGSNSIYHTYIKTNEKNQQRIKGGY